MNSCDGCPGFEVIEKQLDRVLDNQDKLFEKVDEQGKLGVRLEQRQNNHDKSHDKGFSHTTATVMAVAAFLAIGVSIVIAIVK
jgi:hypothetical protein